ncbi:MAG: DUF4493 domain-containing protein [Muribaculaceae bacterium]|nr:DUF4493 domain-containing protein [Muribaculaceae bacterium]
MKKLYIYILTTLLTLLASCGKDAPFDERQEKGVGQLHKSAIGIDLRDEEMMQTRADNGVNIDDFKISITKVGATAPTAVYTYGNMPDVVTLEKGSYVVKAEYGEDVEAEWNSPYYMGESDTFTITPDNITDDIGDIVCRLQNIKVSINFGPILTEQMSEDSGVEVRVSDSGDAGGGKYLRFTKNDQLRGNCGYFRHAEGVSLIATFNGMVEGLSTTLNKSYSNVQKGYHYKITFKLNNQASESIGDLTGGVNVNASVTVTDVERNVDVEDDELLDDSERPREDDPETPPAAGWQGPVATAEAPLSMPDVSKITPVDGVISVNCSQTIPLSDPNMNVVLNFKSNTGFTEFYADIDSPNLTPEELETVGLAAHLDLVNPDEKIVEPLQNLGLPVNIGGEKNVAFNISNFMSLLAIFGENTHTFVIHAKDKDGELVVNLVLNFK